MYFVLKKADRVLQIVSPWPPYSYSKANISVAVSVLIKVSLDIP